MPVEERDPDPYAAELIRQQMAVVLNRAVVTKMAARFAAEHGATLASAPSSSAVMYPRRSEPRGASRLRWAFPMRASPFFSRYGACPAPIEPYVHRRRAVGACETRLKTGRGRRGTAPPGSAPAPAPKWSRSASIASGTQRSPIVGLAWLMAATGIATPDPHAAHSTATAARLVRSQRSRRGDGAPASIAAGLVPRVVCAQPIGPGQRR